MENLLIAFNIFLRYSQDEHPIACEHDIMYVMVSPSVVSEEDIKTLEELGFIADSDDLDNFYSFKYGSC